MKGKGRKACGRGWEEGINEGRAGGRRGIEGEWVIEWKLWMEGKWE